MTHRTSARELLGVAVANDYELFVAGLTRLLEAYPGRVVVCAGFVNEGDEGDDPVSIERYEVFDSDRTGDHAVARLLASRHVRCVVLSPSPRPEIVTPAKRIEARAPISKALLDHEIIGALEQAPRGAAVVADTPGAVDRRRSAPVDPAWPGKEHGLSERESEVLVLLSEGLTNTEIAESLFLSLETIKSHVSTLMAKLEVRNRVQAATYVARTAP